MAKATLKKAKAKEAVREPVESADAKEAGRGDTATGRRKADFLVAFIGAPLALRFGGSFRCSDHTLGWMACVHTPNDDSSPQRGFWIRQSGRGVRPLALDIEVEERVDALYPDPENPSRVRMWVAGRQEHVVVEAPRR